MTLPESLLTELIDYWTFDAEVADGTNWTQLIVAGGGGVTTQIGHVNAVELPLNYLGSFSGAAPRARFGYGKEGVDLADWVEGGSPFDSYVPAGGTWCYCTGGDVFPSGEVLGSIGEGLTIAVRYSPEGQTYVGDGGNGIWIASEFRQVLAAIGYPEDGGGGVTLREVLAADFNNELCGDDNAVPFRLWHKASNNAITSVNVSGSSVPGAADAESLTQGSFPPFNAILRFVRVGTNEISLEVFIDGVKTGTSGSKITSDFAATPLSMISVGKTKNEHMGNGQYGALTEAAVWTRALTDDEIESIGEEGLDGLPEIEDDEPTGPGTDNPIIDENGDSALNPDWPVERITDAVVLATGGPQRHTRRPHRIAPRRYRIKAAASKGGEVALIQELIHVSRGGAKATRWRHPVDDPPTERIDQLPLYRLISSSVARTRGGQFGTWELVLEEVA